MAEQNDNRAEETSTDPAMPREMDVPLSIIVERRPAASRWIDAVWKPVAALVGPVSAEAGQVLSEDGGVTRFHGGTRPLLMHASEAEIYAQNLASAAPGLYVSLFARSGQPFPWALQTVSLSPFTAQDYNGPDDHLIERIAIPEALLPTIEAFIDHHYKPKTFKKRRRDVVDVDELQFGKQPIFLSDKQKLRGDWNG